jgi:hypothetical protein
MREGGPRRSDYEVVGCCGVWGTVKMVDRTRPKQGGRGRDRGHWSVISDQVVITCHSPACIAVRRSGLLT